MGVTLPWAILMAFQVYTKGVQQNKMPEPFYFVWGSGAMAVCALLNQVDGRLGTVLAWGLLIGAAIANQTKKSTTKPATGGAKTA